MSDQTTLCHKDWWTRDKLDFINRICTELRFGKTMKEIWFPTWRGMPLFVNSFLQSVQISDGDGLTCQIPTLPKSYLSFFPSYIRKDIASSMFYLCKILSRKFLLIDLSHQIWNCGEHLHKMPTSQTIYLPLFTITLA